MPPYCSGAAGVLGGPVYSGRGPSMQDAAWNDSPLACIALQRAHSDSQLSFMHPLEPFMCMSASFVGLGCRWVFINLC